MSDKLTAELNIAPAMEPVAPAPAPTRAADPRWTVGRSPVGSVTSADRVLAWVLALGTIATLWATQRTVGYVRDEGYYFSAAQSCEGWFVELGEDFKAGRFAKPFQDDVIVRYWEYNHEHPVLVKSLFALSHLTFHRWLGWVDDATAYRLPAFLFAGLLSWALFWLARPAGRAAAILAPLLFWAIPRHFFHGHLAAFDVPVVATWCLFFLLYARAVETRHGGWKAGVAFGLALATKHNALFLPFAVVLHWLITDRRDLWPAGPKGIFGRVPGALWAMVVLGPLVLYLHWPYLWHHPIDRVEYWIQFHLQHVHYPWQYLGTELRAPPFPVEYPLVLEALTVPAATLVVLTLGLFLAGSRMLGAFTASVRRCVGEATSREWLLALGAAVAFAPFMTRYVPIFGGVKHWMAGPALLCVFGAEVIVLAAQALLPSRSGLAAGALGALVLVPGALATAHFQPFGTSAYNEIAGGGAGGGALGMQRQYWSNNVTGVMRWLNEHAPRGASVYFHEVNYESYRAYQANGLLRRDIGYANAPRDAAIAVYQYMQEFRDREFEIWTEFGTRTPELEFTIDEAPQITVYERPSLHGHETSRPFPVRP